MKNGWVLIAALFLTLWSGCQSGKTATPDELIGVWRTSAQKYKDRFFKITSNRIIFSAGEDANSYYPIREIQKDNEGDQTIYTITYFNGEGQQYKFSFYYKSENGGTITFKNQRLFTWQKKND